MKVSVILSLFNCEEYLDSYFQNALEQKNVELIEFSVIHNDPTDKELEIINSYKEKLNIKHTVVSLEPLYVSWNRAILQSTGQYLACWNVDDRRTEDSLYRMSETLDKNSNVGFTYGDFIITKNYGDSIGKYINAINFNKWEATTGAIGGPFFMWRKSLVSGIGFFDEQFKSGGDFDYTVRLSIVSTGLKTDGLLGYFLNNNTGLSTTNNGLQKLERSVIERRYGIWHKTYFYKLRNFNKYDLNHFILNGSIANINKEIFTLRKRRNYLKVLVLYGTFINIFYDFLRFIKWKFFKKNVNGN